MFAHFIHYLSKVLPLSQNYKAYTSRQKSSKFGKVYIKNYDHLEY
jgi:hypothetical protein